MKKIIISLIALLPLFASAQYKTKQDRTKWRVYFFSTPSPTNPANHLDWSFQDSVVYMDEVKGGSVYHGGRTVSDLPMKIKKTGRLSDSAGLVKHYWDTQYGRLIVLYSDKEKKITTLIWKDMYLPIYDVLDF